MGDRRTSWMDELDDDTDELRPARGGRRTAAIVALAAVPWIVVVALLVLPGRVGGVNGAPDEGLEPMPPPASALASPTPPPAGSEPSTSGPAVRDDEEARDRTSGPTFPPDDAPADPTDLDRASPGRAALELMEFRGRWRPLPGPEEAAALAVVVARSWLTGVEPILDLGAFPPELPEGYAEHLVVEAVERPTPEAAVVTLLAVVLENGEDLGVDVRRLAVPIAWDDTGPRPAGAPWWLPGPVLDPLAPQVESIDDPDEQLLAVEALTNAGYQDVELHGLSRGVTGWPLIAEVEARTPRGHLVDGAVWLRHHQGRLVAAGTPVSTSGSPPPEDVPTSATGDSGADAQENRAGAEVER